MRKIRQVREALATRLRWRVAVLVTACGMLAVTVSVGVDASAQGTSPASDSIKLIRTHHHGRSAKVASDVTASDYSGGHLVAADPRGGFWTVTWLGAVTSHGGAPTFGSPVVSGITLSQPIVGIAATPDGKGYWLVGADGGIFNYGDAQFYGSTGATHLNRPVVGIAATPDGKGYWLVGADGGVFNFGDAAFLGSAGAMALNAPIAGIASTHDGKGYWLVGADGGIFTFGDAQFHGSIGSIELTRPIVGMAPTPNGKGYWLVASDGGVFTYGNAPFHGSLGTAGGLALGLIVNPSTDTYSMVTGDGAEVAPSLKAPAPVATTTTTGAPATTTTTAPVVTAHAKSSTTTTRAPAPAPTTTTGAAAPVVSASGVPAAPTTSSSSLYPLEQVTNFMSGSLPANLNSYGNLELPPSGFIASSHLVPTSAGLEIKGYPDGNAGATGAGFNLTDDVPSSGGFDVCFSMSAGDWQNVHLVLISWPADSNWNEGENDFFEGNPQDMEINVHQIGSDPAENTFSGTWPASLASGVHVVSARWDPVNGYRYYLDGQLIATAPIGGAVTAPTTPHELAIQMQDMDENSTSSETATIYWTARYGYSG